MKNKFIALLTIFGFSYTAAQAQLQLPQPSPPSAVTQTVGLTEIKIDYSSPGVKGRTIFGGLVPYDKVWRTGANASTKITFSQDVTIEGNKVPKGTYALLTMPAQGEFTVMLSKDENASENSYKQEDEQLRFKAKTTACEPRERLTFFFSNYTDSQTTINLEWEKTRMSFNVMVDTDAQAKGNLDRELGRTWRMYNSAARYLLDNNKELETAMKYADQSIALKEEWFNTWTKAQIYNAMNNKTEAYRNALKAKELGDKSSNFFFKDNVEKALVDWKPNAGTKGKK